MVRVDGARFTEYIFRSKYPPPNSGSPWNFVIINKLSAVNIKLQTFNLQMRKY